MQKNCLEIAEEYGIALTQEPSGWHKGRCPRPEHEDTHPSLRIAPDGSHWTCFPCMAKGDAISLIKFITGCSYADALAGTNIKQDFATTFVSSLRPVEEKPDDSDLALAFTLKHSLRVGVPLGVIDQALTGDDPCRMLRSALSLVQQS
jgi:hypothetical protein